MFRICTCLPQFRKDMILSRVLQFLVCCFGISFSIWAFSASRFRNPEGFLRGEICLPISVGVALIILGFALTGRLKRFAFWLALALVGQAVALQMIDAGPLIHYQHYRPLDWLLTGNHPLLLVFLAVQTVLVVLGIKTRWSKLRVWIGRTFKVWQLLAVGVIFFFSSAALSRDVRFYATEVFFASFIQAISLGNILLMVWAFPDEALASLKEKFDKWLGQPGVEDQGSRADDRGSIICNPQSTFHNPKGKSGGIDRFALLAASGC